MNSSHPNAVPVRAAVEVARLARECTMMVQAHRLADWIAVEPRRLTPTKVLRPADVPAAGAALGIALPDKVRRAGDIQNLHRPWTVALATGMVQITGSVAAAGPALAARPNPEADPDAFLDGWLVGLRAMLAAESEPRRDHDLTVLVFGLLDLIAVSEPPTNTVLWQALHHAIGHTDTYGGYYSGRLDRFLDADGEDLLGELFAVLGEFGMTIGASSNPQITPLGEWVLARFQAAVPLPIEPGLPAGELLARLVELHDDPRAWRVAGPWLAERSMTAAAGELLIAAVTATPAERFTARYLVEEWGESALSLWQEMSDRPGVGPHAREVLAFWEKAPALDPEDKRWLLVERAAAALVHPGADEALTLVSAGLPDLDLESRVAGVRDGGHPESEAVAQALTEFITSGAPRSIDQVLQLKVTLVGWRPSTWRRVLVPATFDLSDLSRVIHVLFGWDGDHMHAFTVADKQYSDPFFGLDDFAEVGDELGLRVRSAFRPEVKKITYLYDFGADWRHEIVLERMLPGEADRLYPACVAFSGDSPQEYERDEEDYEEDEERPEEPQPFDLVEVNRRLTAEVDDDDDDES